MVRSAPLITISRMFPIHDYISLLKQIFDIEIFGDAVRRAYEIISKMRIILRNPFDWDIDFKKSLLVVLIEFTKANRTTPSDKYTIRKVFFFGQTSWCRKFHKVLCRDRTQGESPGDEHSSRSPMSQNDLRTSIVLESSREFIEKYCFIIQDMIIFGSWRCFFEMEADADVLRAALVVLLQQSATIANKLWTADLGREASPCVV